MRYLPLLKYSRGEWNFFSLSNSKFRIAVCRPDGNRLSPAATNKTLAEVIRSFLSNAVGTTESDSVLQTDESTSANQ